jgi:catechol 1,2-dioxygenase
MRDSKTSETKNPRLNQLFDDLVGALRDFVRKNHVTHDEYRAAVAFLTEVGSTGETPLIMDVFLEVTVDQVDSAGRGGTDTCIEGPFYVADAPVMTSPCVLPHRNDEPGDVLILSGAVRAIDGASLPGAVVDIWQADAKGAYSHFNIPQAEAPYNLRARVTTDQEGRFEIRTWVPASYEIPKGGPTGKLLAAMGRHAWRPAHIHLRLTHENCQTLTTQIFVAGDPWIDSDVVGAVKAPLVAKLEKHEEPAELRKQGLTRPYYALAYDFVLPRVMAKAA